MAFNKKQAKQIINELEKTHKSFFRLAACVPVGENMEKLNHFAQTVIDVRHDTIRSVFETFRRRHPHGQYLLIIVCGEDVPANPPDTQRVRQMLAKIARKFTPKREAAVLKLDTNWLDKAFEYQKRLSY